MIVDSSLFLPVNDIPTGIPFLSYPQVVEIAGRDARLAAAVHRSARYIFFGSELSSSIA